MNNKYDIAIVGGGFYGCCLALYLKSNGYSVILFEKENNILTRASAINQARVHTGFHYPRSLTTAIRSLVNFPRFAFEFKRAIVDDFSMIYGIARHGSKVNAKRFFQMYEEMHAPIEKAPKNIKKYFSKNMIEDAFCVKEYAFDHNIIREILLNSLERAKVTLCFNTCIKSSEICSGNSLELKDEEGNVFTAGQVFNCSYSRINMLLEASQLECITLKHEITEMALVKPSDILNNLAITVMDGPFFSIMPYPARGLYTLSHVRFTPHIQWEDPNILVDPHKVFENYEKVSNFQYMRSDVQRYMPELCLEYVESIFEVKTVLQKNEHDDGRPIFYKSHEKMPNMHTVMGSKIDNVYDLFERLGEISTPFKLKSNLWQRVLGVD